ncbi:MAG: putative toxin-antitoxin system toxin component, PIN family [Okeania sp. SIO3H1]|uniref:putative toxin-antitoxin system toxin component, PIN family n=1 Tax=Okeania sp. SIO1I7 TaxID=2607772 RepID=UPI0013C96864|nr:putative toxin-antitoxin system toxin component, PIN family [Okeania sp. SIO1I7]NEN92027.1 putative toxin-antitoxin system toxin component, PIN family [Okeania sp. SIO3H1]NET28122.1 putative toxin-antitoxin system toxin component, PIN family [Okeania sp. SIO1I7]
MAECLPILFSDVTFQELQEVLTRSKFDKYIPLDIRSQFLAKIKLESEQILVSEIVNKCRDPKDDKFLDVALNGQATHIITGDKDLLELNPFEGIPILTPKQFLEFIKDIKP